MQTDRPTQIAAADIVSESLLYPSRSGQKVAAYWDHLAANFEGCPFVVMAPKYGETKKSNLQLAYALAANGMNVVRFDHTCHVGESGGLKTAFTLTSGVGDILGTLDYIQSRFRASSTALLASSLSARTAVRAAALDPRISFLACLVGVVNIQATLHAIYREDVVANFMAGKRWGVTDSFFGHDANWDRFLEDACAADMHNLAGTQRDLASVHAPVVFLSGDHDVWVALEEVQSCVRHAAQGRVVSITGAKHEVRENPQAAEEAFDTMVSLIVQETWGLENPPKKLRRPNQAALLAENRRERERLRDAAPRDQTENDFWSSYLRKYLLLQHVDEYVDYLDLVGELLGPFGPGDLVLDAGCGNGLFGGWLRRRLQVRPAFPLPAVYLGLDLTESGLTEAMTRDNALATEGMMGSWSDAVRQLDILYAKADFDRLHDGRGVASMPRFAAASFDAICCSLVLSYLEAPGKLLSELRRIVRPGGRIVVSSMKPHCDISNIYTGFVDRRVSPSELSSARELLSGVGQIKLKEEQGYYVFYSSEELMEMVQAAGFRDSQSYSSFGDQAVVVRAVA